VQLSNTPNTKPRPTTFAAADEEDDDEASYSFQAQLEGTIIYCPLNRRGSACDSISSSITCSVVSHLSESIMGHFSITNSMNQRMSPGFARGSMPRRGSAEFGENLNGRRMSRRGSAGYCGYPPGNTKRCGSAGYGKYYGYGTILAGRRSSTGGFDHITSAQFDPLDGFNFLDGIDESGSLVSGVTESQLSMKTFEKLTMQGYVRDSLSMNHARGVPKIMSNGTDICNDRFNMESFTTNATLPGFPRDSISMINEKGALKRIHRLDQQVSRLVSNDDGTHSNASRIETIFSNALDAFPRHNVSYHSKGGPKSDIRQLDPGEQEQLKAASKMPQPKRRSKMHARNRTGKRRGYID